MAVDFAQTFGGKKSNSASKEDKPKAQFWINIGYNAEGAGEDGADRFVSLPTGIPLDTQELLPTNSRNEEFAAFQSARNDLLEQIMAVAKTLKPGEERLLNLQIQLRHVNAEREAIAPQDNKFSRPLSL